MNLPITEVWSVSYSSATKPEIFERSPFFTTAPQNWSCWFCLSICDVLNINQTILTINPEIENWKDALQLLMARGESLKTFETSKKHAGDWVNDTTLDIYCKRLVRKALLGDNVGTWWVHGTEVTTKDESSGSKLDLSIDECISSFTSLSNLWQATRRTTPLSTYICNCDAARTRMIEPLFQKDVSWTSSTAYEDHRLCLEYCGHKCQVL